MPDNKMKYMGLEINRPAPLSEDDKAFIKAGGTIAFRRTAAGVVKTRTMKRQPTDTELRLQHMRHERRAAELRYQERHGNQ